MSTTATATHGSATSENVIRAIGIAFRIILDVFCTAVALVVWFACMNGELHYRGRVYHSGNVFHNGYVWTTNNVSIGWTRVWFPLKHGDFHGVCTGIFHNFFSWATLNFAFDTGFMLAITFFAFAIWRSTWVGGCTMVLGGLGLAWISIAWGCQLFGPLFIPLAIAAVLFGLVVTLGVRGFMYMWNMANPKAH